MPEAIQQEENDFDIIPHQLKERWVKIFVDKYTKESPLAAGAYAEQMFSKDTMIKLQPMVRAEFKRRGWTFPSDSNPPPGMA